MRHTTAIPAQTSARALALLLLAAGCGSNASGQTGSPNGEPPTYETPGQFTPGDVGGGNTGTDGEFWNEVIPVWVRHGGDFVKRMGDTLVVAATPDSTDGPKPAYAERGLLFFDVSDPTMPTLTAELLIEGSPDFLFAADGVVVAGFRDEPKLSGAEIPTERAPYQVTRLVRIDASDPNSPSIVAETFLDGNVWDVQQRGDDLYVLASDPALTECVEPTLGNTGEGGLLIGEGTIRPERLIVTALRFDGSELSVVDDAVLAETAIAAFPTRDGYAAVSGEETPSLSLVDFSANDGVLVRADGLPLNGSVTAGFGSSGVVGVATTDGTSHDFTLYDFSDLDAPTELGSAALGAAPERIVETATDGVWLAGTQLLDVRAPSSPVVHGLGGARAAVSVASGVLAFSALGAESGRTLGVALWTLDDPSAPTALGSIDTGWRFEADNYDAGYWSQRFGIDDESSRFFYPHWDGTANFGGRLGVLSYADGALAVVGDVAMSGSAPRPVGTGDAVYSFDGHTLDTLSVSDLEVATLPLYENLEQADRFIDREAMDGSVVTLVRRGEQVLALADRDGSVTTLELPHLADELVVVDGQLVAMGLYWNSGCATEPMSADLAFECLPPNRPGLSVIALGGEPRIASTIFTDEPVDLPELPADAGVRDQWLGFVPLGDGRLALPVQRYVHCDSQAACDALGLEASEGASAGGCSSDGACSNESTTFISGGEAQELLVVLELDAEGNATFLPAVKMGVEQFSVPGEGPLELRGRVLQSGSVLAFPREQSVDPGDNNPTFRHFVDLLEVDEDGLVTPLGSVNVPGRPLLLTDGGETLLSVAPGPEMDGSVDALLHRSTLRDGGAYIDETLNLGPGFRTAQRVEGDVLVVMGPTEYCAEDPVSTISRVTLDEDGLERSASLELPFGDWQFVWYEPWNADTARLSGGPLGYNGRLVLDTTSEVPSVVTYTNRSTLNAPPDLDE